MALVFRPDTVVGYYKGLRVRIESDSNVTDYEAYHKIVDDFKNQIKEKLDEVPKEPGRPEAVSERQCTS